MEEFVYRFYRDVYSQDIRKHHPFLGFYNDIFNHPIMTPNFFVGDELIANDVDEDITLFIQYGRHKKHWIHIFGNGLHEATLQRLGYERSLTCQTLFFDRPYSIANDGFTFEHVNISNLPLPLRNELREKTIRNSKNLSLETLSKIETVLTSSAGSISRYLVFTCQGELVAGLTQQSGQESSLLINAWVEPNYRKQRIMKGLVGFATRECFNQGQKMVFCWTFNPLIQREGNSRQTLSVFEKRL